MTEKKIGFIGCGNMGSAMIGGLLRSRLCEPGQILASARTQETLTRLSSEFQVQTTPSNREVAQRSDFLILAVKPNLYASVIAEIKDDVRQDALVISIAAGVSLAKLTDFFEKPVKLIRAMPNTPALVSEAMSALSPNSLVAKTEQDMALTIFRSFGKAEFVPESLMDTVVGVSGSSPAYAYLFIEAMADAAVYDGMPRAQAYQFAAQAVYGAAKMVLETGRHPGELKDAVCSPGGTTIAAVAKLEEKGLRNAVIEAQRCCALKSKELGTA